MKASMNDTIRTLTEVRSELSGDVIPAGTLGTVVEAYEQPTEGYAVDIGLPDDTLVGDVRWVNVVLEPHQFEVVEESEAQ